MALLLTCIFLSSDFSLVCIINIEDTVIQIIVHASLHYVQYELFCDITYLCYEYNRITM